MPAGAIERIGPRDALVTVFERFGGTRSLAGPMQFALPDRTEQGDAAARTHTATPLDEHWLAERRRRASELSAQRRLKRARDALTPGGRLLVHDFMLDDDRQSPALAALWFLQ